MSTTETTPGKLLEIKGVVVDAVFTDGLPEIYSALRIPRPDGTDLIAEVQQHLGDDRVRAVAMDATDGIARGTDVFDTGGPISVPVAGSITRIVPPSGAVHSRIGLPGSATFATPAAAYGRLFVPAGTQLQAYAAA